MNCSTKTSPPQHSPSCAKASQLGLAIDQNMLLKKGIFVDFFGAPACTTAAPAVMSLRTGATIFTCLMTRNADGTHTMRFEKIGTPDKRGPGVIEAVTQELNRKLEAAILKTPEQWYWVHRRWKTKPPPTVETPGASAAQEQSVQ